MFANPVAGVIRPHGAPLILGSFRVTATFGQLDADHPTPHGGVDIGNGKCGEPLLAMATGRITLAGKVPGSDALIIRGIDPAFPDYEWAVAHCATITVKVGQQVHRGDRIGSLGSTGTTACHCHIGLKIRGVSADVWPYLDQNQENEVISAPVLARISNRMCATNPGSGVKFRADPSTAKPELLILPANTTLQPDFAVTGQAIAGSTQWYTAMFGVAGRLTRGYVHDSTVGPLLAWEALDCTEAVNDALGTQKARVMAALA